MQVIFLRSFSPKKFLNTETGLAVFMTEDGKLVAGEAILGDAAALVRTQPAQSQDELLEDLVRQYSRLVYRIAYAALRSHHDAEDATQETFIRVLRYGRNLAAVEDRKEWLARIAWRVAVDRGRQRSRRQEITLDDPAKPVKEIASSEAPTDAALQSSQLGAMLERLIATLPGKLREPLVLSTIEEMSPREIARTLGINEAAVRSRVFRGRQILRERLAGLSGRKQ